VSWQLVYSKQAQKDAKKLKAAGLKPKAEELLAVLATAHQHSKPAGVRSVRQAEDGAGAADVDAL
jgi:mRNA-degrading endonuclease RelE of RelBE toxin-antitoxin system